MRRKTKKKNSISFYKKKADVLFSQIIRKIGYCEHCGKSATMLQCAHVIPRTYLILRWDKQNALCLCYRCHIHWAHHNPLEFSMWFKQKYPERHTYLMGKRNEYKKWTLIDYKELVENLQKELG